MQVKIGDIIGELIHVAFDMKGNENYWKLAEGKVKSITINSKGRRVKAEHFFTLDADEIEENTKWMTETPNLVLTLEPFILTDELRDRANGWIKFTNKGELSNENVERVV